MFNIYHVYSLFLNTERHGVNIRHLEGNQALSSLALGHQTCMCIVMNLSRQSDIKKNNIPIKWN